jgi:hypothetical protein
MRLSNQSFARCQSVSLGIVLHMGKVNRSESARSSVYSFPACINLRATRPSVACRRSLLQSSPQYVQYAHQERLLARQRERQGKRRGSIIRTSRRTVRERTRIQFSPNARRPNWWQTRKHGPLHSTAMAAPLKICENRLIDAKYHTEHAINIVV